MVRWRKSVVNPDPQRNSSLGNAVAFPTGREGGREGERREREERERKRERIKAP